MHSGRGLKTGEGKARDSLRSKRFRQFLSKERPRNGIFGFGRSRNGTRAKTWKMGRGEGKERNSFRQTQDFENLARQRTGSWLAWLVEHYWHVLIQVVSVLRGRDTHMNYLQLLSLPSDASKGNQGSVIVPQYGSSKITVLYRVKIRS